MRIRQETAEDYESVAHVLREAFWNLYVPGAEEHALLYQLRKHPDFIPELTLVAEEEGKILGHIAYTKAAVVMATAEFPVITFGPVAVLPEASGKGIGKQLIAESIELARSKGHKTLIIHGYPTYYERFGFRNGKEFGISEEDGSHPLGLQVLELEAGVLDKVQGKYRGCPAFEVSMEDKEEYDKDFPEKPKFETRSQQMFSIVIGLNAGDSYPKEFNPKFCTDTRPLK